MADDDKPERRTTLQTAGEFLPDGVAVELVRALATPEQLRLLSWHGEILQEGLQISHDGRSYEPLRMDPSVSKALRLPTRIAPPEPTRQLFDSVHHLLSSRMGQLEPCITKIVFAVFASWLVPVLPMAPIVWIFAPAGSPKNLVMQLLSLLCRRPLRLVGVRRGDLLHAPMSLQPTLLLDEPDLEPGMQSILQASSYRGLHIPGGRRIQEIYGSKIICSRRLPQGAALETDALRIALIPATAQLIPLDKTTQEEIAEEFQARFLSYLLRNFTNVQIPKFDVSHLTLPVQDLARALGAAVVGDEELQGRILPLLTGQDEEFRADRARAVDAVVLEALLFFIHDGGYSKVRAKELAERVAAIYKGRGSDEAPSPEMVGWAVRRLGIPGGRLDSAGNGVELPEPTCRLVHQLAISYGVRSMQVGSFNACRYCRVPEPSLAEAKTDAGPVS